MRHFDETCILVTGGAGFIGSALIRYLIRETAVTVINVDKLTYAGNLESLTSVSDNSRYYFENVDICNTEAISTILERHRPNAVVHLAAESHVDRSIDGPAEFVKTNIVGTYSLLDTVLPYWQRLEGDEQDHFVFHHVSTDEVYGSLGEQGLFAEASPYQPNSPYSAICIALAALPPLPHRNTCRPLRQAFRNASANRCTLDQSYACRISASLKA